MQITKLSVRDIEQIMSLWSKAGLSFKPRGRDSREAIACQMQIFPDFFLGAYEKSRLVGVVILSSDGRKGWINRLAVDPDYRNRGIAKALVSESEKVLKNHGTGIICVLIDENNSASKELFKSCRYVEHRDIVYFSKRSSDEI